MALAVACSLLGRFVAIVVAILTVPLTVSYLGTERYGLWIAVSSLVAMASFADLGIGSGLRTLVADADGRGDRELMVRLTSSGTAVLVLVAIALSAVLLIASPSADWASLLRVTAPEARLEVDGCVLALGLTFLGAMPLQVVQSVQTGLQLGYSATLWATGGSLVSLITLLVVTTMRAGLVPLVLALSGAPLLIAAVNYVWFFWWARPDIRPRLAAIDWSLAVRLLRTGSLFLVLQLAAAFAFSSDNVVVGATLGAISVPLLGVPAKLFTIVQQVLGMVTSPLWPAFGEAAARGDIAWVRRTLTRAHVLSVTFAVLVSGVLVLLGPWIVALWSRGQVQVGIDLLVPLALWTVIAAWGSAIATFLNGTGEIGIQAVSGVAMAIAAFYLKWILIGPLGLAGVVWATILSFMVLGVAPVWWGQRRALRRLAARSVRSNAPLTQDVPI